MVLTRGGAEGAHRSWAFSFIGIAVLCGMAWSFGPRSWCCRAFRSARPLQSRVVRRPGVRIGVAGVVFTVMASGARRWGQRLLPLPRERARRRRRTVGVAGGRGGRRVDGGACAGRHSGGGGPLCVPAGWFGRPDVRVAPSATFPIWDLYMSAEPVRPEVLKQVLDADIRYFVVDARMATTRPRWATGSCATSRALAVRACFRKSALDRFDCLPWLRGRVCGGPVDRLRGGCRRLASHNSRQLRGAGAHERSLRTLRSRCGRASSVPEHAVNDVPVRPHRPAETADSPVLRPTAAVVPTDGRHHRRPAAGRPSVHRQHLARTGGPAAAARRFG